MEIQELKQRRLASWCQDGVNRVPDPEAAAKFIDRHGLATHYSASSEAPNLFWGYMSEANVKGVPEWDSPSGHVYGWRWDLGRSEAAFYGDLVAKKPTWIAWDILPTILGFAMERRDPEELYTDGGLSNEAIRIVRAFEGTSGVLSTKDLRRRAGFPTGKAERAAYLRGVEELGSRLILAKTFDVGGEGDDMSHALVAVKYESHAQEALKLKPEAAFRDFLARYLPNAIYIDPKMLAKHLRVPIAVMNAAVDALVTEGAAARTEGFIAMTT